jgi:hypothetical protein
MPSALSDLELENLDDETEAPPETRIKDARTGRSIYRSLSDADRPRAMYRARHQALLDGEPPYDQAKLAASGQGTRTNVDWGDTAAIAASVMSGVVDMNVSVERLVRSPLRKEYVPDDEMRFNYETILADEITKTIRDWEDYNSSYMTLAHYCFMHGVGIGYFEDDRDWRFEVSGLGDFVIPDGTKSSENRITVAACLRQMEVHELYRYIRNEKAAKVMGWDVEAVKKAIIGASPENNDENWHTIQQAIKNNDLGMGLSGKTAKVGVIHEWVQEFDGTVSKYIVSQEPLVGYKDKQDGEPWLYQKKKIYPEMRQGLVFFTYGIGNGTYHSISGMLRRIYPQALALNRTQSNMLDAANLSVSMTVQPVSENFLSRMKILNLGCISVLPAAEHANIIDRTVPNIAQGAMPVVADLRDTMGKRAGQFQGDSAFGSAQEKTRFQVAAELEALGKVGATQINMWYPSWTRLLREMVRRMCRKGYSEKTPGGKEVKAFKERLEMRGFPLHLLEAIDFEAVTAERAIGAGSGAARTAALTQLRELAGEYDEIGRYNLNRDLTAAALNGNYELADRYVPRVPESRAPMDTQVANLENSLMRLGEEPVLAPGQLPLAHLDSHVPFLLEMVQSIEQGMATMDDLVEPMVICHAHATEHLGQVQDSEIMQVKVAEYRELLNMLGETVNNAMRKKIAEQQREMEEGAEQDQNGGVSPQIQEKLITAQIKLDQMNTAATAKQQYREQEHQQKMRHKEEDFRATAAMKDASAAASMVSKSREQGMQLRVGQLKAAQDLRVKELKSSSKATT